MINEVAWAGTLDSPSDEWIELYNSGDSSVDLTGWTLWADDGSPKIALSGSILAHSYFLLERTSDGTVNFDPPIPLDLTYTGALEDAGEVFVLRNGEGTEMDRVDFWYAGTTSDRVSMERIDPMRPGTDQANWGSYDGTVVLNSFDAGGNPIHGTPKFKNSVSQ